MTATPAVFSSSRRRGASAHTAATPVQHELTALLRVQRDRQDAAHAVTRTKMFCDTENHRSPADNFFGHEFVGLTVRGVHETREHTVPAFAGSGPRCLLGIVCVVGTHRFRHVRTRRCRHGGARCGFLG